jgi:hypothetical protein
MASDWGCREKVCFVCCLYNTVWLSRIVFGSWPLCRLEASKTSQLKVAPPAVSVSQWSLLTVPSTFLPVAQFVMLCCMFEVSPSLLPWKACRSAVWADGGLRYCPHVCFHLCLVCPRQPDSHAGAAKYVGLTSRSCAVQIGHKINLSLCSSL